MRPLNLLRLAIYTDRALKIPRLQIDQFHVGFNAGYDPTYTWDPVSRTWKRSYGGAPFMDTSGSQIAPTNVIVQFVHYPAGAEV